MKKTDEKVVFMNILFVCTGNTCRSPMAEAILRQKKPDWKVKSAGLYANPGEPASKGTATVLTEKGISHHHISSQVTEELLDWADAVLTMTASHKQLIDIHFPHFQDKVMMLKDVDGDVADPFGGPDSEYRKTFEELDYYISRWLEKAARK